MKDSVRPGSCRPRSWWVWVAFWTLLFLVMHVPPPESARNIARADVLLHFAAYFTLTSLGANHVRRSRRSWHRALVGWALIYVLYAGLDEWLQGFVGRSPSAMDWAADACGVLSATAVAMAWRRGVRTELSEPDDSRP